MKMYLLSIWNGESYDNCGIFSSIEKAKEYLLKECAEDEDDTFLDYDDVIIEEWKVDSDKHIIVK